MSVQVSNLIPEIPDLNCLFLWGPFCIFIIISLSGFIARNSGKGDQADSDLDKEETDQHSNRNRGNTRIYEADDSDDNSKDTYDQAQIPGLIDRLCLFLSKSLIYHILLEIRIGIRTDIVRNKLLFIEENTGSGQLWWKMKDWSFWLWRLGTETKYTNGNDTL